MSRTLDLNALKSFVAVADAGGVTRAAGFLNLTQSAVSMQVKRLEDALGLRLLDRGARKVALTAPGEQLLGFARRMLALNDEVFDRLTLRAYEGEIVFGVPADIVYPALPKVLQRFAAAYPRMRVQLVSSYTRQLKQLFARGECDAILTTEDDCDAAGETLAVSPLVWIGSPGGSAWRSRPLRLAFEHTCIFRKSVQEALDQAAIPWEMAVESASTRTIEASVSADLAVHVVIAGSEFRDVELVQHGGALPELASTRINLYAAKLTGNEAFEAFLALVRQAYAR